MVVLPFEHVDEMPWCYHSNETRLRGTICFPSRVIFVWPWNENARTKQKHQTNGNRAIWLVYRKDTNARGFWLVKRTLGWKNFMAESFLEINGCFALTSYYNTIGQSNNAFSILGVFFWGKTKRPCFDLFSHWLIKQRTLTETILQGHTKIALFYKMRLRNFAEFWLKLLLGIKRFYDSLQSRTSLT